MLPKTHILLGAIFSIIFYSLFPQTQWYNLAIIFFSSFLIDFDHYASSVLKEKRNLNLINSLNYHKEQGKIQKAEKDNGIRKKGVLHIFHTLEFHILVLAIGIFFFKPFIFIFIGMLFHSILDLLYLTKEDYIYRRNFILALWIIKKIRKR